MMDGFVIQKTSTKLIQSSFFFFCSLIFSKKEQGLKQNKQPGIAKT
jgi:hypothetical protein